MLQQNKSDHYLVLDAVRGIAAIIVCLHHYKTYISFHIPPFSDAFFLKSYLAVDLFFLMSGLVIEKSYFNKLRSGMMQFSDFVLTRWLRLYPLYFCGLTLGVVFIILKSFISMHVPVNVLSLGRTFFFNGIFLPDFFNGKDIFVIDNPIWSLSFEWIINIVYALIVLRLSNRLLWVVVAVGFAGVVGGGIFYDSINMGWSPENYWGGFARIFLSFPLGILIYRHIKSGFTLPSISPLLILGVLGLLLAYSFGVTNVIYDFLCVFFIFPVVVYLSCFSQVADILKRPFFILGQVSYSLYILHMPLLMIMSGVWKVFFHSAPADSPAVSILFIIVPTVIFSYLAAIWFDEPVRAFLKKRIARA